MKPSKPKEDSCSVETYTHIRSRPYDPERILTGWIAAMDEFYDNYQKLLACVAQVTPRHDSDLESMKRISVGQCSLSLLLEVICNMKEELKKLDQDMDQADSTEPATICEHYRKLTVHTRVLNLLNQKAQDRLYLANSSNQ